MKNFLLLILVGALCGNLAAQTFEVVNTQDFYKGSIGEVIKAPLAFKNTTNKPVTLVIRKTNSLIGTSQRNYFCPDGHCLDQKVEEYIARIEPGQSLTTLQVALESGLVPCSSSVKYIAYNRFNPSETVEIELNFVIEEKDVRQHIYTSNDITIQNLYPNPLSTYAEVGYFIQNDRRKAKIVIHNIVGNIVGEYELPASETKVKIRAEDLNAGIYFYTLYIDNEAAMTRKLIVKK